MTPTASEGLRQDIAETEARETRKIIPPWSDEVVAGLNRYQDEGFFHPFTCPGYHSETNLVAFADGWTCPRCGYRQFWAHRFMALPPPLPEGLAEQLRG